VLLPGIQYEVVSTEVKIMVIENNSTLSYIHPELVNATSYLNLLKEPFAILKSPIKSYGANKNDDSRSVNLEKSLDDKIKYMGKAEIRKRKKQFIDLSKKYSN
jgi:hypothetical protein